MGCISYLAPTVAQFQNIREYFPIESVRHLSGVNYIRIVIAISYVPLNRFGRCFNMLFVFASVHSQKTGCLVWNAVVRFKKFRHL